MKFSIKIFFNSLMFQMNIYKIFFNSLMFQINIYKISSKYRVLFFDFFKYLNGYDDSLKQRPQVFEIDQLKTDFIFQEILGTNLKELNNLLVTILKKNPNLSCLEFIFKVNI